MNKKDELKSNDKANRTDMLRVLRKQRDELKDQLDAIEIDSSDPDFLEKMSEQNQLTIRLKNCRTKIRNVDKGKASHGGDELYAQSYQFIT